MLKILQALKCLVFKNLDIKETSFVEVILWAIFYIDLNLLFLYTLKRAGMFNEEENK